MMIMTKFHRLERSKPRRLKPILRTLETYTEAGLGGRVSTLIRWHQSSSPSEARKRKNGTSVPGHVKKRRLENPARGQVALRQHFQRIEEQVVRPGSHSKRGKSEVGNIKKASHAFGGEKLVKLKDGCWLIQGMKTPPSSSGSFLLPRHPTGKTNTTHSRRFFVYQTLRLSELFTSTGRRSRQVEVLQHLKCGSRDLCFAEPARHCLLG